MACIIWRLSSGEEYNVPEESRHTPPQGAVNTGRIDWSCKGGTEQDELQAKLAANSISIGSAIAWVTKKIGIKQCSACHARQVILDQAQQLGWVETIRQIKDTYKSESKSEL